MVANAGNSNIEGLVDDLEPARSIDSPVGSKSETCESPNAIINPASKNVQTREVVREAVVFYLCYLLMTVLGVYARLGISALSVYNPSYVTSGSVIWSNFSACVAMGILQELDSAEWFEGRKPLFLAMGTGFCGSFSSFSTMMLEIFEHSTNLTAGNLKNHAKFPNRAYGILEFLGTTIIHMTVPMTALIFGRKLATEFLIPWGHDYTEADQRVIDDIPNDEKFVTSKRNFLRPWVINMMNIVEWLTLVMALPVLITVVVLSGVYSNYSRGSWTLPPLFGIFGSLLRYYLGIWLNARVASFPVGTFVANEFAVIMIGVFAIVLNGKLHDGRPVIHTVNGHRVVSALSSGFCGSLSTISTFMNEGYKLPFKQTLIYFCVSVGIAYCILVVLVGSYAWTRGLL